MLNKNLTHTKTVVSICSNILNNHGNLVSVSTNNNFCHIPPHVAVSVELMSLSRRCFCCGWVMGWVWGSRYWKGRWEESVEENGVFWENEMKKLVEGDGRINSGRYEN